MKDTRLIMGMPITVAVGEAAGYFDAADGREAVEAAFDHFDWVDSVFSTYKPGSEISRVNQGLPEADRSEEMRRVLELCEQTRVETNGYFNVTRNGQVDPSGIVKGWAIYGAARLLGDRGIQDFYVDAGGDIQVAGRAPHGGPWRVGIRNPFSRDEVIKIVEVSTEGVATSGTSIRGQHIYNPHDSGGITDVAQLTVIGPNVYEADRFATAAFAMGRQGIKFIESRSGLEGYMVDSVGVATKTSGFDRYEAAA